MVDIAPFRALRSSDLKKGNDISSFICPPYDVISPHERESIERKHPANVVMIELPKGGETEKFSNAAEIYGDWRAQGRIQEDRRASFYLLETTYRIKDAFAPDKQLKRYGVLTALKLETPGKGAIHPHEKTLPKAKEERLNLISALNADVSPIFGLFFDKKKEWKSWVQKTITSKPLVKGVENKQLSHRLWKIDAPTLQNELKQMLKSKDLYIADGHHRYEVAWAYKEKKLQAESNASMGAGWRFVMTYICPMEEPGLLMLPTHRLIKSSRTIDEWRRHLQAYFTFKPMKNMAMIVKALAAAKERQLGWVCKGELALLKPRADHSIDRWLEHRPQALRELDVVLLHDVAMGEAVAPEFLTEKEVLYTRDLKGMKMLVEKDPSWVGFVVANAGVASLARVANAHEVMPPKTTYFYPKVPTGFTLMDLNQHVMP